MPILAATPVVDAPPARPSPFDESRYFSFRSLDGQLVLPFTGDEFIARWGITGLDVQDRDVVEEFLPDQDGSDLDDIKVGSRAYFIPIFCGSNSGHLRHLDDMSVLRGLFNHRRVDYRATGGTFDLVASSVKGERSLRSLYVSGMSSEWAQDSMGSYWRSLGLNFLAVRPNWSGEAWTTPVIRRPKPVRFFGRFPPQLTSSRALGKDLVVDIPGESDTWAVLEAEGPTPSLLMSGPGISVSLPDGLDVGERLLIDTDPRVRRDRVLINGESAWSRIAPSATWAPIAPGSATFNIDMPEATNDTWARIHGITQWDTPW